MTLTFKDLLNKTQKAIEEQLSENSWNPVSVITTNAYFNTLDLTDDEIAEVISSEPIIWQNIVVADELSSTTPSLSEVAKKAISVELEKQIDMTPFANSVREWFGQTFKTPEHLLSKMTDIASVDPSLK